MARDHRRAGPWAIGRSQSNKAEVVGQDERKAGRGPCPASATPSVTPSEAGLAMANGCTARRSAWRRRWPPSCRAAWGWIDAAAASGIERRARARLPAVGARGRRRALCRTRDARTTRRQVRRAPDSLRARRRAVVMHRRPDGRDRSGERHGCPDAASAARGARPAPFRPGRGHAREWGRRRRPPACGRTSTATPSPHGVAPYAVPTTAVAVGTPRRWCACARQFQRDRDRISIAPPSAAREYKTQVFLNHEGDLFCTRLTHSNRGGSAGAAIARAFWAGNEDRRGYRARA